MSPTADISDASVKLLIVHVVEPFRPPFHEELASGTSETREAILSLTFELLKKHGISGITTEMIAGEARISKATIYQYWTSKQELLVEAVRAQISPLDVPDTGSFDGDIGWLLHHRFEDYRRPGVLRLVADILGQSISDPQLSQVFEDWVEGLSRAIRQCVHRAISRGEVSPDVDGLALESIVAGVVARAVVTQKPFTPESINRIAELLGRLVRP